MHMKLKREQPTVFAIYHDLKILVFVSADGSIDCFKETRDYYMSYWIFKDDEIPVGRKIKEMRFADYFAKLKQMNIEYFCYYFEKDYPCCLDAYEVWTKVCLDKYLTLNPDFDERYRYLLDFFNEA